MRYELPDGLTQQDERAVVAALDHLFGLASVRPSPWALAVRAENLGLGGLQFRHQFDRPYGQASPMFTRRGTETRIGRGDTR